MQLEELPLRKEERQDTLETAMLSEGTVKAEIMWSLEVLKNKFSYQSCRMLSEYTVKAEII